MVNNKLFTTLLKEKIMTLIYTYYFTLLGLGLIVIPFLAFDFLDIEKIKVLGFSLAIQAMLIALFIHPLIQAYSNYYTHFPLALFTGKTRKEFLVASLLTSGITLLMGVMVMFVLTLILPDASTAQSLQSVFKPSYVFFLGFTGLRNLLFLFLYLGVAIQLLACLNYRTGVKVWLFLFVFSFVLGFADRIPKADQVLPFARYFNIDHWTRVLSGELVSPFMALFELFLGLGLLILITLRLSPVDKENLS